MSICVECDSNLESESLYTEYSEGNIRLTRCAKCRNVADKYIEYEQILVYIDIILHKYPAYRHLFFNRQPLCSATLSDARMVMLYCICINIFVKLAVFGSTEGDVFRSDVLVLAVFSSIAEHVTFVATVFLIQWKWTVPSLSASTHSKFFRKIYLSLAYPELGKACAVVLLTWDSGLMLLLFIGILILSIQYNAFRTVINHNFPQSNVNYAFFIAYVARLTCRWCFYRFDDALKLGILL